MIKIFYWLAALAGFSHLNAAADTLVFPASEIESIERVYTLDKRRPSYSHVLDKVDEKRLADTLLMLLAQPSQSCREKPVARASMELFRQRAAALDIDLHIDDLPRRVSQLEDKERLAMYCNSGSTAPESGNLVVFIPGNVDAPSWNISFHLDTNQLKFDGFSVDGDIISPPAGSPLGADDKAGIAITAEILHLIAEHGIPHGDIRIVGLVAEEDTAVGAELVKAHAFKGDILVSIDGTDPLEIGRAAPTIYDGHLSISTVTSHPADVDTKLSVSACALGSEILYQSGFRANTHPPGHPGVVLHSYFTSCGINKGETTVKGEPLAAYQYNTISPYFTAAWQMRNLEGDVASKQMVDRLASTMNGLCQQAANNRTAVKCEITGTDEAALVGYVVPEDAASIVLLERGFRKTGTEAPKVTARQFGGFNGNLVKARFGEEMVIVGTGADQIHTNQETASISGMARVTRGLLAAMLESYRYSRGE